MNSRFKVAAAAWLIAALPALALAQGAQLTPPAERISDRAIHADHATMRAMQGRIHALNERGRGRGPAVSDYHLSKAQCWLDVSFHEYTRNDRSAFPQAALREAERLVDLMERGERPLPDDTPLVNDAAQLRPDLWAEAQALRQHDGARCAARQLACAEVELVHAGHEYRQLGWRHASPYVQLAEDHLSGARAAANACPVAAAPAPAALAVPAPAAPSAPPAAPRELKARLLFAFDKAGAADITPASRATLDALLGFLTPAERAQAEVAVTGHADRLNGTGNARYNAALAERRAKAVAALITAAGVPATAVRVDSRADSEALVDCRSIKEPARLRSCLQDNRRVDVRVTVR